MGVRAGTLAVVALLATPAAHAAAPGDNLLVSRPSGMGAIDQSLFAWNGSGRIELAPGKTSTVNVTADGRYVVFATRADGLAPGEDPGPQHIVRKDRQTGATVVVDAGANDNSTDPDISDDGRFVVFASNAPDLAAGDTSRDADVFVKDLADGTVRLLSDTGEEPAYITTLQPVISANGSKVAFATGNALDATNDTNGKLDVYAVNADGTGSPQLVSATGTGAAANGDSAQPSIVDDGSRVAYISSANDLQFGNDPDTSSDLYVRDLASVGSFLGSAQNGFTYGIGAGGVFDGEISGDGLRVVFTDTAQYLPADADSFADVWRRTLASKVDDLISVADDETNSGAAASGATTDQTGSLVTFTTGSTNVGGTANGFDLYVRDADNANTKVITDGAEGIAGEALTHGAGDLVAFAADAPLADGPGREAIHAAPELGGAPELISSPASGVPLQPGLTDTFEPNFTPEDHRVSADGRYVVFSSFAPALGGPADTDVCWRRDMRTGETLLVSTGPSGPVRCFTPSISADGGTVAFLTDAALDGADSGSDLDAYVHDIATAANTLASRADGPAGLNSDGAMYDMEMSADGKHVAFEATATNLGAPGGYHVYERDVPAATTQVVDRTTTGAVGGDAGFDSSIGIDATGRRIAFATRAPLDVSLDGDTGVDVYVRDVQAGTTMLASVQSAALGGAKGSTGSLEPALSGNGRVVAFLSSAPNLDPAAGPITPTFEVFVHDLDAQTTRMASVSPSGAAGDAGPFNETLDDSGDVVAFEANGPDGPSNLSPNLDPLTTGVVVRRLSANTTTVVQAAPVVPTLNLAGRTTHPALSPDGRCLAFFARGRGLVEGVSPDFVQLYEHVLDGDCGTNPPSPPAGEPPPAQPAAHAPGLTGVSMTNRRFRVGPRRTAVTARRKKVKVGTTFRFTLSDAATVGIRLERLTKGRRAGKRCVKPTRKLRKHKPCTRAELKGTLTRKALTAGARRVPFSGRVGKRKLAPGRHRATLMATGATGLKSATTTLSFRIVR